MRIEQTAHMISCKDSHMISCKGASGVAVNSLAGAAGILCNISSRSS